MEHPDDLETTKAPSVNNPAKSAEIIYSTDEIQGFIANIHKLSQTLAYMQKVIPPKKVDAVIKGSGLLKWVAKGDETEQIIAEATKFELAKAKLEQHGEIIRRRSNAFE